MSDYSTWLHIAQIIISIALTAAILVQIRSSGMGSVFGATDSAIYRTRRGVERLLFNITIGLAITFFVITLLNVIIV
jgi:preprotein translocase subunit SecG